MRNTLLSFVIPCYRSEKTISKVVDEIIDVVSTRDRYDYEIICVNDSSPDDVYTVLQELARSNGRIKVVDLAKNMGKHAAVLAGYSFVTGDYVVNLDDDCQCPTYELWRLLEPLEREGYDIATARYPEKKQAKWKNLGSSVNALVSTFMLEKPKDLRFENFSIIRRYVMDESIRYDGPYPYLEGLFLRVSRRIAFVDMKERDRGDNNGTGYTFKKSLSLFVNGFTAFSVKPLRISTFMGVLTALIGFLMGLFMIVHKLVTPDVLLGYTSTMVVQLFIGGLTLMSLGMLGEYVGRIYISMNKSPQYVVRETMNCDAEKEIAHQSNH